MGNRRNSLAGLIGLVVVFLLWSCNLNKTAVVRQEPMPEPTQTQVSPPLEQAPTPQPAPSLSLEVEEQKQPLIAEQELPKPKPKPKPKAKVVSRKSTRIPVPTKFPTKLEPRSVAPAKFEMVQVSEQSFPRISLEFRLFGRGGRALTGLTPQSIRLEARQPNFKHPRWLSTPDVPLNQYFPAVPAAAAGILSLKTVELAGEESAGRLLVLFRSRPGARKSARLSDEVKDQILFWTKDLPGGVRVRLADMGRTTGPEHAYWSTSWLAGGEEVRRVLQAYAKDKAGRYRPVAADRFNAALGSAIRDLTGDPYAPPSRLVVIIQGRGELATPVDKAVATALQGSRVVVDVCGCGLKKAVPKETDLVRAARYSGGEVLYGAPGAAHQAQRDAFVAQTKAFAGAHYLLTWLDTNFNDKPRVRTYQLHIQSADETYRYTAEATLDPELLRSWRNKELAAAGKVVKQGSVEQVQGVVRSLLARYPLGELENIFAAVHDRALAWLRSQDSEAGFSVLTKLQDFYRGNPAWKKRFRTDCEIMGDVLWTKGAVLKASRRYQRSLEYGKTQEVYEKLLKCQMRMMDFEGAQRSAQWIYVHGDLSGRSVEFVRLMAFAYGAGLKFSRAEKLVRRGLLQVAKDDPLWTYPLLTMKGFWFGGAARMIAEAMPHVGDQQAFAQLTDEFQGFDDVAWIGFASARGTIRYCTDRRVIGKPVTNTLACLKNVKLASIHRPVFLSAMSAERRTGVVLTPVGGGRQGFVVFAFDSKLDLTGRRLFAGVVEKPADDKVWNRLQTHIAHRCGAAMAKTLARLFERMSLSPSDWKGRVVDAVAVLPGELNVYNIVSGRADDKGPIQVLYSRPPGELPNDILDDGKANRNPYFMYVERRWRGRTVHEFTTAVYAGKRWLGVMRNGYAW